MWSMAGSCVDFMNAGPAALVGQRVYGSYIGNSQFWLVVLHKLRFSIVVTGSFCSVGTAPCSSL